MLFVVAYQISRLGSADKLPQGCVGPETAFRTEILSYGKGALLAFSSC